MAFLEKSDFDYNVYYRYGESILQSAHMNIDGVESDPFSNMFKLKKNALSAICSYECFERLRHIYRKYRGFYF